MSCFQISNTCFDSFGDDYLFDKNFIVPISKNHIQHCIVFIRKHKNNYKFDSIYKKKIPQLKRNISEFDNVFKHYVIRCQNVNLKSVLSELDELYNGNTCVIVKRLDLNFGSLINVLKKQKFVHMTYGGHFCITNETEFKKFVLTYKEMYI